MAQQIVLNKLNGTISLKRSNKSIVLQQTGRRGPKGDKGDKGDPGDPASNIVTSVNGKIGAVVLTTADINDTALRRYTNDSDISRLENTSGTNTGDQDLSGLVPKTTTINGYSLSSNIILTKSDLGLGNVDNTSDLNKPISTAAAAALASKADDSAVVHNTGNEAVAGVKTFSSSPIVPTPISGTQAVNKDYVDIAGGSYQPLDATLTALAGLSSSAGLIVQTSTDAFTKRSIAGTTNQVIVTNGDGASGNPTLSLPQNIHTGATPLFAGMTLTTPVSTVTGLTVNQNNTNPAIQINKTAFQHSIVVNDIPGVVVARGFFVGSLDVDAIAGLEFRNTNAGTAADSRFVFADTTGHYVAFSMPGVNNAQGALFGQNRNQTSFLFSSGGTARNMAIGTLQNSYLVLGTNGTERIRITEAGLVGIGTIPTHSLTLPSSTTGIVLYNTSDQVTNYERIRAVWSSNIFSMRTESGGTGVGRTLRLGTPNTAFDINETITGSGAFRFNRSTSVINVNVVTIDGAYTQSSGLLTGLHINPTFNQSGSAGYTGLLVNAIETGVGSGVKNLVDFQVGGTSRVRVDNTGVMIFAADTNIYRSAANILKTDDKFIAALGINMGTGVGVPATAASAGVAGDVAYDGGFLYICTATNTWRRVAIASW